MWYFKCLKNYILTLLYQDVFHLWKRRKKCTIAQSFPCLAFLYGCRHFKPYFPADINFQDSDRCQKRRQVLRSTSVLYTERQRICILYFTASTSVLYTERRMIGILYFKAVHFSTLHQETDDLYTVLYRGPLLYFTQRTGGSVYCTLQRFTSLLYSEKRRICILFFYCVHFCTLHGETEDLYTAVYLCTLHGETDNLYTVLYCVHFSTLHQETDYLYTVLYCVHFCTSVHYINTSVLYSILVYNAVD